MRFLTVLAFLCTVVVCEINAQRFAGFKAAKRAAEYEAQRFLMNEVFEISDSEITNLHLNQCAEFIDDDESFIFVITGFKWNGEYGIVITSLVVKSNWDKSDLWLFKNVKLSEKEYNSLNQTFAELTSAGQVSNGHKLMKFGNRLIAEFNKDRLGEDIVLWVDENRHSFSIDNWNSFYKAFAQFKSSVLKK